MAGLWSPERRALTLGLVLTITLVAFESLAIATVMPEVKDDLGGLALYGWVFSGFFLASLLGIVVSGQLADRRGLALPYSAGLVLFTVGLVVGGSARSMAMLVAGRVAQGFGAGAIPAVAYAAIGRGYRRSQRPRMFATISTAWVVPGLIGPGVATLVAHTLSWRWVFLGLIPIVAVAAAMAIPALRALGSPAEVVDAIPAAGAVEVAADDRRRLVRVVLLVLGVGAVLAATGDAPLALAVVLVVGGLPLAAWSFVHLVPAGTVRLAPGVPATVAVRGLLTCSFFAGDAYVSLAITDGRGGAIWVGGAALSAGCVTWSAASWVQARLLDHHGPRRLVRAGLVVIAVGMASMLGVSSGLPVGFGVLAWAIASFGMGLAFSPLSVTVLGAARPGQEGSASAALQLSDTLGIAVGTGVGGSIIAFGDAGGWAVSTATAVVFAAALASTVGSVLAARRLPTRVPSHGVETPPGQPAAEPSTPSGPPTDSGPGGTRGVLRRARRCQ
ncbi:MAG: arabinose efflux permease family protein [Acidimicrobiales bacterium]|nr:arabinose efflux permease family protein [Acidimicrobiales bacterium]